MTHYCKQLGNLYWIVTNCGVTLWKFTFGNLETLAHFKHYWGCSHTVPTVYMWLVQKSFSILKSKCLEPTVLQEISSRTTESNQTHLLCFQFKMRWFTTRTWKRSVDLSYWTGTVKWSVRGINSRTIPQNLLTAEGILSRDQFQRQMVSQWLMGNVWA